MSILNKIIPGDCYNVLKKLPNNCIDAIVTDPPYGWSLMGSKWDYDIPSVELWKEVLRVLKPGGHALIACGTRTQHRMVSNIEEAGFEIRDNINYLFDNNSDMELFLNSLNKEQQKSLIKLIEESSHLSTILQAYGSGFPKSMDISKQIDKMKGEEREIIESYNRDGRSHGILGNKVKVTRNITISSSPEAKYWEGWGTALKPAVEYWTLCRKPLSEKTIAENIIKWGVGGINIDGCRIPLKPKENIPKGSGNPSSTFIKESIHPGRGGGNGGNETSSLGRFPSNLCHDGSEEVLSLFPDTKSGKMNQQVNGGSFNVYANQTSRFVETIGDSGSAARYFKEIEPEVDSGRFPSNLIIDDSEEVQEVFNQAGESKSRETSSISYKSRTFENQSCYGKFGDSIRKGFNDKGNPSRFFYCSKSSRKERNLGCGELSEKQKVFNGQSGNSSPDMKGVEQKFTTLPQRNIHPTCKPLALMKYLVTLIAPENSVVLDPFIGSGTTGVACINTNRKFVGIELCPEYIDIANARINYAIANKTVDEPIQNKELLPCQMPNEF